MWDYRIVKLRTGQLALCEVYYDRHNQPISFSEGELPFGESLAELHAEVDSLSKALRLPILDEKVHFEER